MINSSHNYQKAMHTLTDMPRTGNYDDDGEQDGCNYIEGTNIPKHLVSALWTIVFQGSIILWIVTTQLADLMIICLDKDNGSRSCLKGLFGYSSAIVGLDNAWTGKEYPSAMFCVANSGYLCHLGPPNIACDDGQMKMTDVMLSPRTSSFLLYFIAMPNRCFEDLDWRDLHVSVLEPFTRWVSQHISLLSIFATRCFSRFWDV